MLIFCIILRIASLSAILLGIYYYNWPEEYARAAYHMALAAVLHLQADSLEENTK